MGAPRLTEAKIARVIKAARDYGCPAVEIEIGGTKLRILVGDDTPALPSASGDGVDEWAKRLGSSG